MFSSGRSLSGLSVTLASIKTNELNAMPFGSLEPYVQKEGFSRFRHFDILENQDLKPMDLSLPAGMSLLGLRIKTDDLHVLS